LRECCFLNTFSFSPSSSFPLSPFMMADDEPVADAPAEQVAAPSPAPAAAPAASPAVAAAAAAPPPSTAKKAAAKAPASTKKKAAKPAPSPASTPARAGRERKKVEFFSPPQAVVKEDLVQVKVGRCFFLPAVLLLLLLLHHLQVQSKKS
jgi:hypothetical protein